MASYHYDEAGTMAAYFILTFLFLVLVPLSVSLLSTTQPKSTDSNSCQCQQCITHRAVLKKSQNGSFFLPNIQKKTMFAIVGWLAWVLLAWKMASVKSDQKIYDPFEILGIRSGTTDKEIKSHFKKLSRLYHPDKVKLAINETMDAVEARFVEITKAYKSLTDETIRKNWELYGHPDGRQEISMGIALPKWIIDSKNNIWVLGLYGLVFGGALPVIVGQWWFGTRSKTKDGVTIQTASTFFKALKEESGVDDVVAALGKSLQYEIGAKGKKGKGADREEIKQLEGKVAEKLGAGKWAELKKLAGMGKGEGSESRRRGLVLLYAHLLRLDVKSAALQAEQRTLLLHTPTLLNSFLQISTSRNWLSPTLSIMRLQSHLAQAIPPSPADNKLKFSQLPGVEASEVKEEDVDKIEDLVDVLSGKGDGRVGEIKKAVKKWGRLDVVDASFKVIGERLVTPSAIVFLLLKLRISPPGTEQPAADDQSNGHTTLEDPNEEKDLAFLNGRKDAEDLPTPELAEGWAHAPYWPSYRKPGWWVVLADDKSSRVVVPPTRITEVPFSDPSRDRNYRCYKLQFQAPPGVGLYTWRVYLMSDTFVGEDVVRDIALKVDDVSALNADEQAIEDEISDPEEDSLAGQMAAMRGGSVKKRKDEDSDDESSTDDDKKDDAGDSSSDSD
ncbi:hypothetical protein JAAARDRAFT_168038 [Jaapia argillacea MUCL 33604]|uniref:J domain-containing protein n=1 Tax=Jaapia argillacea MUCL 33604 TaxID=933084 RepID=A0A067QG09_9AGAM|nr:hypothetical protein JAAARDRAFT_168038 [Jaapia argillacea MUCL 33604]